MERASPAQPPRRSTRAEPSNQNTSKLNIFDDASGRPQCNMISQLAREDLFFKALYHPGVRLLLEFISDDYKTMRDIEREILGKDEAESCLRRVAELEIVEKIKTEMGPAYRLRPRAMIPVHDWLGRLSGNSGI
ncbi:hypothetical protein [Methylobacterium komagatae]|jgi:hypothetical protein|uniref:hypothetical protein n=2 Tax=Pseudomonadota TaxID=1224 RepID=UPI0017D73385